MEGYRGNREPFVFVFCSPGDRESARETAALLGARTKVFLPTLLAGRNGGRCAKRRRSFPF